MLPRLLAALGALLFLAAPAAAAPTEWPPDTALNPGRDNVLWAYEAGPAGHAAALYLGDPTVEEDSGGRLSFREADGTWNEPEDFPFSSMWGHYTDRIQLALDAEGDATIVWMACETPYYRGSCSVLTRTRRADGTWTDEEILAPQDDDARNGPQWPSLAVNAAGDAIVAWDEYTHLGRQATIRVRRRVNGEWQPHEDLQPPRADLADGDYDIHGMPSVALNDDGDAFVAWTRSETVKGVLTQAQVHGRLREAGDASWQPRVTLASGTSGYSEVRAAISSAGVGRAAWLEFPEGRGELVTRTLSGATPGDPETPLARAETEELEAYALHQTAAGELTVAGVRRHDGPEDVTYAVVARTLGAGGEEVLYSGPGKPTELDVARGADGTTAIGWTRDTDDFTGWRAGVRIRRPGPMETWSPVHALGPDDARGSTTPLLSVGAGGAVTAVWSAYWIAGFTQTSSIRTATTVEPGAAQKPPVAAFTRDPAAPVAGQTVTFGSTSADADGQIVSSAWDLDDDGEFTDATGPTAQAVFAAPGTYTVELEVTDDDGHTDVASQTFTVAPAPGDGGDDVTPAPGGGGAPAPVVVPPPALPFGFVVTGTRDTTGTRTMPSVVGRDVDAARVKVVRALEHADVRFEKAPLLESKLPKKPGGGRWRIGDVIAQTPAPKTSHTTSTAAPASVKLRFWAGEKGDPDRCEDLRRQLTKDDLQLALDQLKAAGCPKPKIDVKAGGGEDPQVGRVQKDGDLTLTVPRDQAKLDITLWKTTGFLDTVLPGPAAEDFTLTAGETNVAGVIMRDRAQRVLTGGRVRWDLSDVGGRDVETVAPNGVAPARLTPRRAGTIHVVAEWHDAQGERIYGYTTFKVLERRSKSFVTATGRTFERTKGGSYVKAARVARAAGVAEFFAMIGDCLRSIGGAVAASVTGTAEGVLRAAQSHGTSAMQLGRSVNSGPPTIAEIVRAGGNWILSPNGVVASGSANVVAPGSANVVAAGSANVVASGSANVVASGSANVVAAGSANLVTLPDGAKVVASGSANVVAAGSANVVASGSANIISDNGLG